MKNILMMSMAAATLMLSSCGLYTKYDSATDVDPNLFGEGVEAADTLSMMGNMAWSEIFTDMQLQSYIDTALVRNADMQSAVLAVANARTSLTTARMAYLPSLALSGEGSISGLMSGGKPFKSYQVPLTASWEIDLFGGIRNEKMRAKMMFEQTEYVEQAVRAGVVASVANVYYSLSMLDEQIVIAEQTLESWSESMRSAEAMMEAGMMNEAGLSQIRAGYLGVKTSLLDLQHSRREMSNTMCSLLGMPSQDIEISAMKLEDFSVPSNMSVGMPLQMLSARPDVMSAEAALAASFYSVNMARSSFYPKITLMGTAGWTNSLGSAILDPAEFIYNAVASAVAPIFSRGLNKAQLKVAKSNFESSRVAFEQKLVDAGIEVNNAMSQLESTSAKTILLSQQVAALERAAESTELMMENGHTTYLEVLTAQQSYYSAQLQEAANRFAQMQGLISLYTALGGGRF